MNEKRAIERGTVEGFLVLYNKRFGTDFKILELGDAPDVRCVDRHGNILNLEISVTEDRRGDVKALLGRSDTRSFRALSAHIERVRRGQQPPQFSDLAEVRDRLVTRIESKLRNDYGPNTALVIRDTSGVDWDWDLEIPAICSRLDLTRNPFGHGIWLLSRAKDRLFQII